MNNAIVSTTVEVTLAEISSAQTALSTLFANMQETGYNAALSSFFASNPPALRSASAVLAAASSIGLVVSTAVANYYLGLTTAQFQQILEQYGSVQAIETEAIQLLQAMASAMETQDEGVHSAYMPRLQQLIPAGHGVAYGGVALLFGFGAFFVAPEIMTAVAVTGLYYGALAVISDAESDGDF